MAFIIYYMITLGLAFMAIFEKFSIAYYGTGSEGSYLMYIGLSIFMLVACYGAYIEEKGKRPGNPF